jgi:outer membrane protein assembly factor BamB
MRFSFLVGIALLMLPPRYAGAQTQGTDIHSSSNVAEPTARLLWRDELDVANQFDNAIGVTVSGSNVIVVDNSGGVGGGVLIVRAYDAKTGTVQWMDRQACCGILLTSLGDTAYVVAQENDMRYPVGGTDIIVRAYDARNGNLLWRDDYDVGREDHSTSVLATRTAIVVVGYTTGDPAADGLQWIARAYDPASGDILWDEEIGELPLSTTARYVDGDERGVVIAGNQSQTGVGPYVTIIRSYNPTTGALHWQTTLHHISAMVMRATDGLIYLGGTQQLCETCSSNSSYLAAFSRKDGRKTWQDATVTGWIRYIDVKADKLVALLVAAGNGLLIRALDSKSGTLLWTASTTPAHGIRDIPLSVIASGSAIYVGGITGVDFVYDELALWFFHPSNGALLFHERSERSLYPAITNLTDMAKQGNLLFLVGAVSAVDNPLNRNLLVRAEQIEFPHLQPDRSQ